MRHSTISGIGVCMPLIFQDSEFSFQLLRALGVSICRCSEIGECLSTPLRIRDGDLESWYAEWRATGDGRPYRAPGDHQHGRVPRPPAPSLKEHRLAARIANGGAFELGSTKPPRMSAEDRGCLFSDPAGFDTATGPILAANPSLRRASTHSMWGVPVQTASPARWLQMTEAYTLERGAPIASRARPSSSTASTSTHSPARPASSTTHSDVKRRSCISPARTEQVSTARSPRACSRSSVSSTGWTGCLRCDPETASRRTADHLPIYRQPCNLSLHGT